MYISFMGHCNPKVLLKENNIRATKRKVAILRCIIDSNSPLSARELHRRVSPSMNIDIVTVYRTLSVFKEAGVVRDIRISTGTQYFEMACVHNPVHPHFLCTRCRRMSCLRCLKDTETEHLSEFAGDCEVDEISITITGICPECLEAVR